MDNSDSKRSFQLSLQRSIADSAFTRLEKKGEEAELWLTQFRYVFPKRCSQTNFFSEI